MPSLSSHRFLRKLVSIKSLIFLGARHLVVISIASASAIDLGELEGLKLCHTHQAVSQFENDFLIHVRCKMDPTKGPMIPPEWREGPGHVSALFASPESIELTLQAMRLGIGKYPLSLIQTHLKEVRIFGQIYSNLVPLGGTYLSQNQCLFLSAPEEGRQENIESLFHHELSSILLKAFGDPKFKEAWISLNSTDFRYQNQNPDKTENPHYLDASAAHPGAKPRETNEELLKKGFLNNYSTSNFENDFNTIAEAAMAEPKRLAALLSKKQNQTLKKKYLLWLELMKKASPKFQPPEPLRATR